MKNNIEGRLLGMQDLKYREFHRGIVPTVDVKTLIGIRMPQLRALAKEVVAGGEGEEFMATLPHRWYEEYILHAIIVTGIKDFGECLRQVERLLPYVDNWAVCDVLRPRCFTRHTDELLPHIRRWMSAEHEYTVRFGIGMLEAYYLGEAFSPEQMQWVAEVDREEYYIRMMQAWYFATALAKQWDAALPVIPTLPEWVRRKSIQKARESFRVTAEHKEQLKTLTAN